MNREWMYGDRRTSEYIMGVNNFLEVAVANKENGFMCCPCTMCGNTKSYSERQTLHIHLLYKGFMPHYNVWTKHGEIGVMMEDNEEEEYDENYVPPEYGDAATGEAEDQEEPDDVPDDDLRRVIVDERTQCESEKEKLKFDRMLEDHKKGLYPNCEVGITKLSTVLEMLQWKADNVVPDKGFEQVLKVFKNNLPKNNELPDTTYAAKKVVCPLGLEVQKILACPNDCILYRGAYEDLNAWPVCGALWYKIRRDDPGDVDGEPPRKRVPAKAMWYAPLISRLKRLFRNEDHAKLMQWHREDRKKDRNLRHPADGSQWRKIERKYRDEFGGDPRNVWFGLSADGINPFGEQRSNHSTWPMTLCMYNLPPWKCMKRKFIMMPILIQGPKQPGNDIDVYLRPLVEELLQLWNANGVRVWDEHKKEEFYLHALLFVTINDWPALSNLSGQTNKGYHACTHCLDDTESIYPENCRKNVYMGHRQFLPTNHQCRKKGKHFKGEADHRKKPAMRTGDHVLAMVNDLHIIFGKGPGVVSVMNDDEGRAPMWKKKSIFWGLPYWKELEIRSSIDVMHVTKNLCVNLLGFLGVYGKTKDTPEAREDLQRLHKKDGVPPMQYEGPAS